MQNLTASGFKYPGFEHLNSADPAENISCADMLAITLYSDTIKAAKAKAKYMLSEEYMNDCESTQRLQRVLIFKGTECMEDFTQ